MLLSEPQESPYDLRFILLGFPVRIAWTFWIAALVLGYNLCYAFPAGNLTVPALLVMWSACIFASILIHELGHALAFRHYGINASIVLYHFGGLAIPTSFSSLGGSSMRLSPKQDIVISLAGPLLQIASAMVIFLLIRVSGYQFFGLQLFPQFIVDLPWISEGEPMQNRAIDALVTFYLYPSIMWAVLNLLPIWPLDGGRIARSVFLLNRGTEIHSLWLSVITAGAVGLYFMRQEGNQMTGLFFLMFAISSFQMIQSAGGGPRRW